MRSERKIGLYKKNIKNILELKKLLDKINNQDFNRFCVSFLNEKFYKLGILENKKSFLEKNFSLSTLAERDLINIILRKKLAKKKKECKRLIKKGLIQVLGRKIKKSDFFLDREMENNLSLKKIQK